MPKSPPQSKDKKTFICNNAENLSAFNPLGQNILTDIKIGEKISAVVFNNVFGVMKFFYVLHRRKRKRYFFQNSQPFLSLD